MNNSVVLFMCVGSLKDLKHQKNRSKKKWLRKVCLTDREKVQIIQEKFYYKFSWSVSLWGKPIAGKAFMNMWNNETWSKGALGDSPALAGRWTGGFRTRQDRRNLRTYLNSLIQYVSVTCLHFCRCFSGGAVVAGEQAPSGSDSAGALRGPAVPHRPLVPPASTLIFPAQTYSPNIWLYPSWTLLSTITTGSPLKTWILWNRWLN